MPLEDERPPTDPRIKHGDRVFNARLDQVTGGLHTLALAVVIGGALRYILDPSADASTFRVLLTSFSGVAIELVSLYIMGWRRPED